MARLDTLLFRQRLKKKDRESEEEKLKKYMMEVDPEAAKADQEKGKLKQV